MVGPQLIIYGTRGVTMTKERGEFNCPNCGDQQPYRLRRVRRFFTLYFIPLIPLDKLGEYIECDACSGTYELDVLSYEPGAADAAFEAEFHFAMRRVMILMMLADGAIDDAEVATICQIFESMSGQPLDELQVRQEAMQCQQAGIAIEQYLASTAGKLNAPGKEMVIKAAFFVAMADGVFAPEEQQLLERCGQALGLSSKQVQGILAEIGSAA